MSNVQLAMSNDSQPRKMKTTTIPFCEFVPVEWDIIPNRYLFVNHSIKVGENANDYQLLSLTTGGVKKKDINASGGKVPTSYDNYQTVSNGDMIFCLFDLDCSAVFSGLSPFDGMITSAYDVYMPDKKYVDKHYIEYWFQYVFSYRYYKMYSKSIRYTITSDMFKMIVTPVPPIQEQQIIGNFLDRKCTQIDALIANEEQQIAKLKAYKQSVITETVTKGLDPDVPMKDSGYEFIGSIPECWEICRLRHIGLPQNGISKGGEYFGSGYPFVSYGDIYKNYTLPETVKGLVETTETERKLYSVEKGDIFFTRTSETIEEVGFSCVCEKTIPNATFAGFVIRVRPFNEKLLTVFSKYYFRSNHHRFYLVKEMNLVTRASLGQGLLKSMPVLIPPLEEQQQIADYLDQKCEQIDRLIAIKQKKIEKLQQYKKSVIYEYVTGKREVSN